LTALLLIAVFVLVLINAFFVIAEYSLVRSRRPKLEAAKDEGLRGASLALDQLDNINEYISACQVGITLTSIGIGAVGEPVVAELLEPVRDQIALLGAGALPLPPWAS
jgi:CBS domain containing-hemolysin-like protein